MSSIFSSMFDRDSLDESSDDFIDIELRSAADVAARAIVLATVTRRGILEVAPQSDEDAEATRFDLALWLGSNPHIVQEAAEVTLLGAPIGSLTEEELDICLDAAEATVTLDWCLAATNTALPQPSSQVNLEPVIERLSQPWQDPMPAIASAVLRTEQDIAIERERAEIWWWRASLLPEDLDDTETQAALRAVASEAATANLIDTIDSDLALLGRSFAEHDEDTQATVLAIAAVRLRTLNWVCGFGESWTDAPLDIG